MTRYFANSTEGDAWQHAWCDSCSLDHGMHNGALGTEENGCPIFLSLLVFGDPVEITARPGPPFHLPPDVVCSAYEPCHRPGCSGDPQPEARASARARVAEYVAGELAP